MNPVQQKLLGLLMEVDSICKRNGIDYIMCGGCALGIERNRGFLPWDDDIDLFITRDNLNKLDKALERELPNGRAWLIQHRTPNYNNPLPRYMDTESTVLFRSWLDAGIPTGQAIEFFVLDPYPNEMDLQADYNKHLWLYAELQASRFVIVTSRQSRDVVDADLYRSYSARINNEGLEKVLDEIERKHLTYSIETCDYMCARWGYDIKVVRKEWVDDIVTRDFEGVPLPFFRKNIEYLQETEYGFDWQIIPTESNQESHDTIVNMDIPYRIHEKQVQRISKKAHVRNLQCKNKADNIEILFAKLDSQEREAARKTEAARDYVAFLESRSWEYDDEHSNEYRRIFKPLIDLQSPQSFYKHHKRVELRPDLLDAILMTLLYWNRMNALAGWLSLYPEFENAPWYRETADAIWDLHAAKYSNDDDAVRRLLNTLVNNKGLTHQLEVERAIAWLASNEMMSSPNEDIESFHQSLKNGSDYEIMKYLGDLYYARQDILAASEYYKPAMRARNGMLHLDLNDKGFYC